jgi:hypothetical protein
MTAATHLAPDTTRPSITIWPAGLVLPLALAAAIVGAVLLPGLPAGEPMANMTHYMGLLAANQPWHLLLFMAVPVMLAETIAITELALLFNRSLPGRWRVVHRQAGIVLGLYFIVVFVYLVRHAVIPLTTGGGWRGPVDAVAVGAYLAGVVPLAGIAALEVGWIGRHRSTHDWVRLHVLFVGLFLVVAHVAMIAGMLDPGVFGWNPGPASPGAHAMHP